MFCQIIYVLVVIYKQKYKLIIKQICVMHYYKFVVVTFNCVFKTNERRKKFLLSPFSPEEIKKKKIKQKFSPNKKMIIKINKKFLAL